jgi:alpha-L-arabinofuranosidase
MNVWSSLPVAGDSKGFARGFVEQAGMLVPFLVLASAAAQEIVFQDAFDMPEGGPEWRTHAWRGAARFERVPEGREGSNCLKIRSETGADAAWHVRLAVRPLGRYRLTGWIRTEGVEPLDGEGALFNLHARPERSEAVVGTSDWKQVALEFDSGMDDEVQLNCLLGYFGNAKGTAWFDDVKLELLSSREMRPAVKVVATQTKEPISPYVYGQFIEHLGRCIYGGIWAEMLEDRKFLYLPGSEKSPWRLGAGLRARHEPNPFREQPVLAFEGGGWMQQAGLRLKEQAGFRFVASVAGPGELAVAIVDPETGKALESFTIRTTSTEFQRLQVKSGIKHGDREVALRLRPAGQVRLAAASLMPADNIRGMRADTLRLLKELDAPIYRWPGGNFVSAYDWRDGIGERDRRPTRKNPAWQGIEPNDFGLHEFLDFCQEIGTEPLIVANSGFGDAHSAFELVQYVNGSAASQEGAKRAANGRKEPWKVAWWGIGNEMYGDWQHGHMKLEFYAQKHNDFARKMRQADPTVKLVGVGAAGPWSEGMLTRCADAMDLLSEHFYCQERANVSAHVAQMPNQVRRIAEAHRDYRRQLDSLKNKDIRIALDEWNYWYGPHVYGELGTVYFQKDALGVAAGLHEIFRNSDLYYMANYAQTVNVIGAIKTTATKAAFDTTGLVLREYRKRFGTIPVEVGGAPEPLDVAAAWSGDRKRFTIGIVNPTAQEQALELDFVGAALRSGTRHELAADPSAFNTPEEPERVRWISSDEAAPSGSLRVSGHSVTLFVFPVG